ncbi:MAG: helix-turn-helix transcriptional regulator [Cytophagales bacterium]|jgi:DNA-binding HxlR family transcriptional regulator|nr:helix-turn-helix transcriptional regulator [Cytophagales bacterium]
MEKTLRVEARCPVRTATELLGGKWKMLIIQQLAGGTLRFGELKSRLPDISEKMLVQELKILADSDLVQRINHGEVPPRVEYSLTEMGRAALPLIGAFRDFGLYYMRREMNGEKAVVGSDCNG